MTFFYLKGNGYLTAFLLEQISGILLLLTHVYHNVGTPVDIRVYAGRR